MTPGQNIIRVKILSDTGTARPVGQCLTYRATGALATMELQTVVLNSVLILSQNDVMMMSLRHQYELLVAMVRDP